MAKKGNFQTNAEYFAVRLIIGAIGLLPLRSAMFIGKMFGKITHFGLKKLRKTARRNLEIALPELSEKEKANIVRGCFESLGRQLGLVSKFPYFSRENVRELVELEGRENFDKAVETKRGVLLFTGHFGSWEVFGLLPSAFGYTLNILVRRIDNPLVENFVDSLRTRFGSRTIDKKVSARKMFRLLENGEMLGILADLNAQEREGVFVDFFGVPASTTASIAKLALKTDAVIVPAFAVWNEEKRKYIVHLEPMLEFTKSADHENDVLQLTQKVTKIVEDYVRRFPEQWLWIHKRWNTRPKGETGLY